MKFPNALKGISKLYTAEIMVVISAIALGISSLLFAQQNPPAAAVVIGLIATLLILIAFILQLVGLVNAGKDEPFFKKGLIMTIAGIALSALSSSFANNAFLAQLFSALSHIASLLVTVLVIKGVMSLAAKVGNEEIEQKGNSIIKIVAILYVISIVLQFIQAIFSKGDTVSAAAGIIGLVAEIVSIIQSIIYLRYLGSAKQMLS